MIRITVIRIYSKQFQIALFSAEYYSKAYQNFCANQFEKFYLFICMSIEHSTTNANRLVTSTDMKTREEMTQWTWKSDKYTRVAPIHRSIGRFFILIIHLCIFKKFKRKNSTFISVQVCCNAPVAEMDFSDSFTTTDIWCL